MENYTELEEKNSLIAQGKATVEPTLSKEDGAKALIYNFFGDITAQDDSIVEAYDAEQERLQKEKNEIAKQTHFEHSGVGSKYWGLRLSDFDAYTDNLKKNLEVVQDTIQAIKENKPRTLWMCGANGNGKSMLSAMIARECWGMYTRMYNIEDALKDADNFHNSKNRTETFESYANVKVLIIDEVGRNPDDKIELKNLFHILNDRYENEKSTILVTNLSKKGLAEYLGKALTDRFVESCVSLEFTEASYRKKERVI